MFDFYCCWLLVVWYVLVVVLVTCGCFWVYAGLMVFIACKFNSVDLRAV